MTDRFKPFQIFSLRPLLWTLLSGTVLCCTAGIPAFSPPATKYPEAVLRLTGNRQPFTPKETGVPYELPLKKLVDAKRGIPYGSAVKLTVEPLGEKLFMIDTAARGLLLKSAETSGKGTVHIPEWVLPGPGIQTGIFRLLGRITAHDFSMEPAVAELFQGKGFTWVDGIVSTEILSPWLVRLDFHRNRLTLLPYQTPVTGTRTEWEGALDRNWWIVAARANGRPAHLLLDSGSSRTYFGEEWIQRSLGNISKRQRAADSFEGKYYEAGVWKIEIEGAGAVHASCLYAGPGQMPVAAGKPVDGVLGYDALRDLVLDLDYRAGKIYILR